MTNRHFNSPLAFIRILVLGVVLLTLSSFRAIASDTGTAELRGQVHGRGHTLDRIAPRHWTISPEAAERAFENGELRIVSERYAGRGVTGARRLEIELPDADGRIQAKWKPMPHRLDGINNSPRRELAAYEVQKLFLDAENYVVPTSGVRCIRAEEFIDSERHRSPTLPGTNCELGVLSLWLERVTLPDQLLDKNRFANEPVYARHLADFNLATYLMKHQDGRRGNFLVSTNDEDRRVFAIDNGVAFSGIWFNWFVPNWKKIRTPALRKVSVDRLRLLTREKLDELGVVVQLEWQEHSGVRVVEATRNLDSDDGVRSQGRVIQLGLEEDEIENLWERIEHLIEDVDDGEITVF